MRAAIAAKADGIVTTSPDPGSLVEIVKEANAAHIPIINFNTPDPKANFNAYVGGDNVTFGKRWAQYLVDHTSSKLATSSGCRSRFPAPPMACRRSRAPRVCFKPLGIT